VTLPLPGVVCGYHLSLLRKKLGVEGAFLFWALISDPVAAQFHSRAKGITRYAISVGDVKDVSIPLPPENVQLQIASFLESETTRFDLLIEKQKKAIELLKEKRSALISAAVTGKIDVRDWTPPEKVA
jgi:type I restriction enzyme S subunit